MTRVGMEHLWGVSPLTRTLGKGGGCGARLPLPRECDLRLGAQPSPFMKQAKI